MEYACKDVLVVDDSDIDLYLARVVIQKCNFSESIELKNSAADALRYLKDQCAQSDKLPQFIFLDIRMPAMDGFEFLSHFENLSQEVKDNCRIVMLTSSEDPEDIDKSMQNMYVVKYIRKPLNPQKLSDLIP